MTLCATVLDCEYSAGDQRPQGTLTALGNILGKMLFILVRIWCQYFDVAHDFNEYFFLNYRNKKVRILHVCHNTRLLLCSTFSFLQTKNRYIIFKNKIEYPNYHQHLHLLIINYNLSLTRRLMIGNNNE